MGKGSIFEILFIDENVFNNGISWSLTRLFVILLFVPKLILRERGRAIQRNIVSTYLYYYNKHDIRNRYFINARSRFYIFKLFYYWYFRMMWWIFKCFHSKFYFSYEFVCFSMASKNLNTLQRGHFWAANWFCFSLFLVINWFK